RASPVTFWRASMRGAGSPMLASGAGAARFMSDLQFGGLLQRANQRALTELDLEFIVFAGARLGGCRVGRLLEQIIVELLAPKRPFDFVGAPRHGGDAAERNADVLHGLAVEVEGDRG